MRKAKNLLVYSHCEHHCTGMMTECGGVKLRMVRDKLPMVRMVSEHNGENNGKHVGDVGGENP